MLEIEVANYNAIGAKTEEKLILKHYYVYTLDNHHYYNIIYIYTHTHTQYTLIEQSVICIETNKIKPRDLPTPVSHIPIFGVRESSVAWPDQLRANRLSMS